MEININEYIRTNEGIIDKVDRYSIGSCVYHCKNGMCIDECETVGIPISDIKKHSFNIIDLIEEGDVIVLRNNKKYEVLKISWSKSKGNHIHIINALRMQGGIDIFADDIKSIVTKEQFERMKYEV